ncbi:MAG: redox-regulated ATPase YchF [Candidatus Harrisonbacteria bacterium CG10_big_fil_rev_8_21_14_0_10_42_17]|uniref:Redox-regulated ATPase YchF n=1 Tax=Candidatus Harrisonbacteria bacterium CG10_big_fil_rev_8_21_14_0_10_42_17 TaxID=1974584 RepID=A0A2M6WHT7_9BACT|nr:MAG: redox-regulated ATPase YchF [Candidatus Harrisonbacteria bacterium CG10_big_fil_rev_8_21_14_0_10_42_17]
MKLSLGIVGLPNVGKSTLFNIVTDNNIDVQNYPFCTIDPNVGVVPIPDERLDNLAEMSASAKKIPAIVEFYDIAGLVKGASGGEGLGNKFLANIREVKAIVHVLRCFPSETIIHVENSVHPLRDLEIINTELMLKDLEPVEKRWKKLQGEAKTGNKQAQKNFEVLSRIKNKLEAGEMTLEFADEEIMKDLQLLSAKKQIFLLNGDEHHVSDELKRAIKELGADYVIINLHEVLEIPELIKAAYKILDLISFFTTGSEETRAWTIRSGARAPEAAGTIHTDFEQKFIRAEVIGYEELIDVCSSLSAPEQLQSFAVAKQKGKLRIEGKDYIVKDGDVLVIRHG